jgi:2-methylcitrate dehydratase PrpD
MKSPVLGHAPPDSPTQILAEFVADFDYESLPAQVKERGSDILLDSIASALAGRYGDETRQVAGLAVAIGGDGPYTVVSGESLSLAGSVLLNGYQITAVTLCDMHVAALNHVTPGVISAVLGMAQHAKASGSAMIRAVLAGLECSVRIGLAIDFETFRDKGWHAPGVIGPFGAAAAAGSLLELDGGQMVNAFGLAGSQSAGTYAAWGTPTVKFHQTRGGLSGVLAGLLAAEDFISSQDFFTHPDGGLFTTYTDGGHPDRLTEGLGTNWVFDQVNLRRWPAATQFQSIVEALLSLISEKDPQISDIDAVRIYLPDDVYQAFGGFGWEDKFNARLSPRYVAAVVLTDRRCWVEQFQTERLADRDLTTFARDKVTVMADSGMSGVGAHVEIDIRGDTISNTCPVPKGDAIRPLSRDEIVSKFHDAREGVLSDSGAEEFLDAVLDLDSVDDVTPIIRLLSGS